MVFFRYKETAEQMEVVMANIDLQQLLMEVIATYGRNEGYEIPTISWPKENMLSRYGEFQFWHNHIFVSNMMNTDKVSIGAIKSVIYHEYTHQIMKRHNAKFNARMKLFPDYDLYMKELEEYYNSIDEVPDAQTTDIVLDASEELVICKLPYDPNNEDIYWQRLMYYNHFLTGVLSGDIPEEFCRKPVKQILWVLEVDGRMYTVGWAKDVQLFPTIQKGYVRGSGVGTIEYQFKHIQHNGKVIMPCNTFECLYEGESPKTLLENGICNAKELDEAIVNDIINLVNSYSGDYVDIGILDSALDSVPGILIDDVSELIKLASDKDGWDRNFLIMNKAVDLEKSYRTYLHRGLTFMDCWVFDKALEDFQTALKHEEDDTESIKKSDVEKYIVKVKKAMEVLWV